MATYNNSNNNNKLVLQKLRCAVKTTWLRYCWLILLVAGYCSIVIDVNAQSQCPSRTLGSRLSFNGYCECSLTEGNYYLQCFGVNLNGLRTAISAVDADKIGSLIIRRSRLPSLPANLFKRMKNLKQLSIINSGVQTIPCNLFESKDDKKKPFSEVLEVIDFSFNELTSLCSYLFFGPLSGLTEDGKLRIDLHHSQLRDIPKDLFGSSENQKVAEIDISWNPLADLPDGIFSTTSKLQSLDMSHNRMKEFRSEWFKSADGAGAEAGGGGAGPSELKSLDLDNNRLRTIRETNVIAMCHENRAVDFQDFSQLEELDLSGNYISSVSEKALPKTLVKLDLGNNLLHTLPPQVFDGLSELRELDLSSNPFEHLPAALFSTNDNLKQLALRNYPQGFLSPQIFGSNVDLDTIDFSGANLRLGVQRALLGEAKAQRGALAINVDTTID